MAAVEGPAGVRRLEPAVPQTPQERRPADPEDGQVDMAVAIDVERVGTVDRAEVGDRVGQCGEPQGPAHRAVVAVQGRRSAAAGQVHVRPAVAVAVEDRDASADVGRVRAVVGVFEAGGRRLLDEMRWPEGGRGRCSPSWLTVNAPAATATTARSPRRRRAWSSPGSPGHRVTGSPTSRPAHLVHRPIFPA